MTTADIRATICAICLTHGNATELYPANFSPEDLSPAVFSARRVPDRIHYRMVRCNRCGLVRSDPVADSGLVAALYSQSSFDYGSETKNLAITYGAYLARLDRHRAIKGALLEIGCGNGFFLEQARHQGYSDVRGVEPSEAAVQLAAVDLRDRIVCSMMTPGLFPDQSFDVVCLFQVLDHIFDPASLLLACRQILKPGGLVLCLNHNVEALSAHLMKSRSPIIDIEHTYLYSPATITRLFAGSGFDVKETGGVRNRYSLSYLMRLLPAPLNIKQRLVKGMDDIGAGAVSLWVPLGNLYVIAQKPA